MAQSPPLVRCGSFERKRGNQKYEVPANIFRLCDVINTQSQWKSSIRVLSTNSPLGVFKNNSIKNLPPPKKMWLRKDQKSLNSQIPTESCCIAVRIKVFMCAVNVGPNPLNDAAFKGTKVPYVRTAESTELSGRTRDDWIFDNRLEWMDLCNPSSGGGASDCGTCSVVAENGRLSLQYLYPVWIRL
ncbi:hypothetical protein TNCV_3868961 [Trichonephila clavipes]|nr:hypothetical protein TNCV_3868961 [Trichonephila clavipes]